MNRRTREYTKSSISLHRIGRGNGYSPRGAEYPFHIPLRETPLRNLFFSMQEPSNHRRRRCCCCCCCCCQIALDFFTTNTGRFNLAGSEFAHSLRARRIRSLHSLNEDSNAAMVRHFSARRKITGRKIEDSRVTRRTRLAKLSAIEY